MSTLYCPKCSYNLSNLTENRCPECGEAFDPDTLRMLQAKGVSPWSLILQIIFVPILFAIMAPICLITTLGAEIFGIAFSGIFILGAIVFHACYLSRSYVRSYRLRFGDDRTPWVYRHVWACCTLIAITEVVITFMYFAGGCAVILMNLNFH